MTARDQRGLALSVWTSVSLPAFILMVGLGVDFAGHAAAEQEARAVASQAARAATHELRVTSTGATLDVAAAKREAVSFARAAGFAAEARIEGGNVARVTVRGAYDTLFLGLIGVNSIGVEVDGSARAVTTVDGAEA
ncbi:MAG TPA: hypothetical protein VLQ67_08870 [Arachnia sp.]|nr:hypothetical protein [Arachnia sp.]